MNLPEGIKKEDVDAKVAAGLTIEQAIEVLTNQAEHDKKQNKEAAKQSKK